MTTKTGPIEDLQRQTRYPDARRVLEHRAQTMFCAGSELAVYRLRARLDGAAVEPTAVAWHCRSVIEVWLNGTCLFHKTWIPEPPSLDDPAEVPARICLHCWCPFDPDADYCSECA